MDNNKELGDLNRQIEEDPENIELYISRVILSVANKDYESAIEDCKRIIEISPNFEQGYCGLGESYKLAGQYEKSIEAFSKAIELQSENIYYYGARGNLKYIMKNFSDAIEDYSKAIDLDADFSQDGVLFSNRAASYYEIKDYESALNDYKKSFELDPCNKEVFYNLERCRLHLREGWTKEDYLRQLELEPEDYLNYMVLANFCQEAGELEQAEEYLSKCIELVQVLVNPAYLVNMRGDLRVKLSDFDGAIEDYTKLIELEDVECSKACAFCKRAGIYKKQKRRDEASADYETAIKLREDCTKLFKKTPWLYIKHIIFKFVNFFKKH